MKTNHRLSIISVVAALALGGMGCDEKKEFANWRQDLRLAREAVIVASKQDAFKRAENEAFKAYFGKLQEIVLNADHDEKFSEGLRSTLKKVEAESLCRETLLPADVWERVLEGCQKNRFFLCSEEVRAYPEILEGIRLRLRPETAESLRKTDECWIEKQ